MKLIPLAVLCLALLLVHANFSLAGKGKSSSSKKTSSSSSSSSSSNSNRGSTNSNSGHTTNQGTRSGHPNHGREPVRPGQHSGHGGQDGFGGQGGQGGFGGQGSHGGQGDFGGQGGFGSHGGFGGHRGFGGHSGHRHHGRFGEHGVNKGYPGGYINKNNQILNPHYGVSLGYGGNGVGRGSPFSNKVNEMGYFPSEKSKGFGRNAVIAAGGGAVMGMAVGYGLGRFPPLHFHFRNQQEERYYNYYMYKKYGVKSTDTNDYSRDYKYSAPPQSYENYMDSCMNTSDLLPAENRLQKDKPDATTTTMTTTAVQSENISNTTETVNTTAHNSSNSTFSTSSPLNPTETKTMSLASQAGLNSAVHDDDDDDTVTIVEMGYPALIEQLKIRRCSKQYINYSDKFLKKNMLTSTRKTPTIVSNSRPTGGVQGLQMGMQSYFGVLISTILMLLNSSMLLVLHCGLN